jgi:hypothetical protein
MKIRIFVTSLALAALALPAAAQEVAGKWSGNVDTPQGPFPLTFDFAVMGAELTGALLNDFIGQIPISEGMVDGNEISFKLSIEMGPGASMTISYTGVVEGDELELTSTFEGGAPPGSGPEEQTMTLMRAE